MAMLALMVTILMYTKGHPIPLQGILCNTSWAAIPQLQKVCGYREAIHPFGLIGQQHTSSMHITQFPNLFSVDLRKIGISKKKEEEIQFFFFCQSMSTSFDIFIDLVTYRVTNFLPKLVDMLLFSTQKQLNFLFLYS